MELERKTKKSYKHLTPEQKKQWFGELRNARRRAAYKGDPALRADIQAKSLERHRENFGVSSTGIKETILTQTRESVMSYARPMLVRNKESGKEFETMAFTIDDVTAILGLKHRNRLSGMVSSGFVPDNLFECLEDRSEAKKAQKNAKVYIADEVMGILQVFQAHFTRYCSLRRSHVSAINAIRINVERARRSVL